MKLAVAQTDPRLGQVAENLAAVDTALKGISFDLLVLPELFATGYYFNDLGQVKGLSELVPGGPTTAFLQQLARSRDGFACGGLIERDGGRLYNSAVLAGPDGFLAVCRKLHLYDEEQLWFTPGDKAPTVHDLGFARVGLMICFDWIFPEVARSLALQGAQLLAHPANLVLHYCHDAMITRCLENGLFAATANRVGTDVKPNGEKLKFTGRSQVVAPDGQRLCSADAQTPQVLQVEIDPTAADSKAISARNHLLNDRRPEHYRALVDSL
ncbi:MAG: nitrilase-related carbon-nitrogen hydrolase [Candidatus Neomarinimicrobiota bacterium]